MSSWKTARSTASFNRAVDLISALNFPDSSPFEYVAAARAALEAQKKNADDQRRRFDVEVLRNSNVPPEQIAAFVLKPEQEESRKNRSFGPDSEERLRRLVSALGERGLSSCFA